MSSNQVAVIAVAAGVTWATTAAAGGTYTFEVSCEFKRSYVVWETGALDPGREYLRVVTGTHNPDCSVSSYSGQRLPGVPVIVHRGGKAIFTGIPFVGEIARRIFF